MLSVRIRKLPRFGSIALILAKVTAGKSGLSSRLIVSARVKHTSCFTVTTAAYIGRIITYIFLFNRDLTIQAH
jgi:hypothetical protein